MRGIVFSFLCFSCLPLLDAAQPEILRLAAQQIMLAANKGSGIALQKSSDLAGEASKKIVALYVSRQSDQEKLKLLDEAIGSLTSAEAKKYISDAIFGPESTDPSTASTGILQGAYSSVSGFAKDHPKIFILLGAAAITGIGYSAWKWWHKKKKITIPADKREIARRMLDGKVNPDIIQKVLSTNEEELTKIQSSIHDPSIAEYIQKMVKIGSLSWDRVAHFTGLSIQEAKAYVKNLPALEATPKRTDTVSLRKPYTPMPLGRIPPFKIQNLDQRPSFNWRGVGHTLIKVANH
jgi:hypothetical protein